MDVCRCGAGGTRTDECREGLRYVFWVDVKGENVGEDIDVNENSIEDGITSLLS